MTPLLANAGTPLILGTMLHLLVGNALIGIGEAWLIGRVFKVPRTALKGWLIGANYFSGLIGFLTLLALTDRISDSITIYNVTTTLATLGIASYAASILLEWPFIARGCRGQLTTRSALLASLVAQTGSYIILAPLYWSASGMTVVTRTHTERTVCFARRQDAIVFFNRAQDGRLYRVKLDGTASVAHSPQFFDDDAVSRTGWVTGIRSNFASTTLLLTNSADQATRLLLDLQKLQAGRNWGPATDLRPVSERVWLIRTGFWGIQGLTARNTNTQELLQFSMEAPLVWWPSRCATVLPGDQVVYQLGNQIVLLDIHTRQLTLLGRGRYPIVALPTPPADKHSESVRGPTSDDK